MTMFKMCIDYNAQAVTLMADGRYPEAVKAMKIALQSLREEQNALVVPMAEQGAQQNATGTASAESTPAPPPPTDQDQTDGTPAVPPPPEAAEVGTEIQSVRLMTDAAANKLSCNNLFQLYPCAFVVNPAKVQEIPDSRLTAVLLYNFGLATHIAAIQRKEDSVMLKALAVYHKVIQYVHATLTAEGQAPEEEGGGGGELIWLMIALACNTGHVHSHRLDFSNTRETLSWLLRLITLPLARHTVPAEDFGVFFENVCTFLEGMTLSISPAA